MDASVVYDDVRRTVEKLDVNILEAESEVRGLKLQFNESLRELSDLQLGVEMRQAELTRLRAETKAQVENETDSAIELTKMSLRPQLLKEKDEHDSEETAKQIELARKQISVLETAISQQRTEVEPALVAINRKLALYSRALDISISHPVEGGIRIQFNSIGGEFSLRWNTVSSTIQLVAPDCNPKVRDKIQSEFGRSPNFGKLLTSLRKEILSASN